MRAEKSRRELWATANEVAVASIVPLTAIAMSSGVALPAPVSRPVTFTGGCCEASDTPL